MNVAVLGATGRTGRNLVTELLARGHNVAVLVRDPARLDPASASRVRVVIGDSRTPADLDQLLTGTDAVISALGPTGKEPALHRDTAAALIPAMTAAGITRFVGISGAGIDAPGDQKSNGAKIISWLIQNIGRAVAADKRHELDLITASDLDWTLVRPPRLQDGPATGHVEHDAHRSTASTRITRGDLAVFLADCLDQDLYPPQAPFVATART